MKIREALNIVVKDVDRGKRLIKDVLLKTGIKEETFNKVDQLIKEANSIIKNTGIDYHKLLLFSQLIARRNY